MIGLDTPETVDPREPVQCFGFEASAQAKSIFGGQSVFLETDPSQDSVDRFGRTLAYIGTESGRLFNLDMIADGYAFEYNHLMRLAGRFARRVKAWGRPTGCR
jgi:micrococcal nuclease